MHTAHCTLHTAHFILNNAHCTLHNAHFTQHYTLHTAGVSPWPEYQSKKFLENQYDQVAWRKVGKIVMHSNILLGYVLCYTALLFIKLYCFVMQYIVWVGYALYYISL